MSCVERRVFKSLEDILRVGIEVTDSRKVSQQYKTCFKMLVNPYSRIIIQKRMSKHNGPIKYRFVYKPEDIRLIYTNIYSYECIIYLHANKYSRTFETLHFMDKTSVAKISDFIKTNFSKAACIDVM